MTRKTENSGQTAKRRKTGGRDFKRGEPSPNPKGRPKKEFDLVTRCRELTPPIIERYAKLGRAAQTAAHVLAGRVVIEYGHDKPRQRTELTGPDGAPLVPGSMVTVYMPSNGRENESPEDEIAEPPPAPVADGTGD
jgi:hypothetical protein